MTSIDIFLWGMGGSIAIEIINFYNLFMQETIIIPDRYKSFLFWVVRIIISLMAGGLAVAYDINTKLLAINVGASAPLIFQALSQGISKQTQEKL